MNYLTVCIFSCLLPALLHAQDITLRTGDLLFQDLDCGAMCDAIETVTFGIDSLPFSHVGMVIQGHDSIWIAEAIRAGVVLTSLQDFLARPQNTTPLVMRFHDSIPINYKKVVKFILSKKGLPYDNEFLFDNGKYYCSELLMEAFNSARPKTFLPAPMTFKYEGRIQEVWQKHFEGINQAVPEGKKGINPGLMSRHTGLSKVGYYSTTAIEIR